MTNVNLKFKKRSKVKVKRFSTHRKVLSQGILMWNIKTIALPVQKLLAGLKFSPKKWFKLQGQGHSVKNNDTHGKVLSQGIFMWNIKALAPTVQKLVFKKQMGQTPRSRSQNKK